MRRLPLYAAVAGLLTAVILYVLWLFVNAHANLDVQTSYETLVTWLWPSSIDLMLLEGRPSWVTTALVFGISFFTNAAYYGLWGWVIWWIAYLFQRAKRPLSSLNKFLSTAVACGFAVSLLFWAVAPQLSIWPFNAFNSNGGGSQSPHLNERIMVQAIPVSVSFGVYAFSGLLAWYAFRVLKFRKPNSKASLPTANPH